MLTEDFRDIANFLAENPRLRDAIVFEALGVDVATARASVRLAENFTRPEWADVHKTSMGLSGQVSRYRSARLESDAWIGHEEYGRCAGECSGHGV